jgi:hypothetical protein
MFINFTDEEYFEFMLNGYNKLLFEDTIKINPEDELDIPSDSLDDLNILSENLITKIQFTLKDSSCISKLENTKCNYLKYINCDYVKQINLMTFIWFNEKGYNLTFNEFPTLNKFPIHVFTSLRNLNEVERIIIANVKFNNLDEEFYNPNSNFIKLISQIESLEYINFYRTNIDIEKLQEFIPENITLDNSIAYVN